MKKVIRIILSIDLIGIDWIETEWSVEEKNTTFHCKNSDDSIHTTRRIQKDVFWDIKESVSPSDMTFSAFALPTDVDSVKGRLLNRAKSRIEQQQENINTLASHINS